MMEVREQSLIYVTHFSTMALVIWIVDGLDFGQTMLFLELLLY